MNKLEESNAKFKLAGDLIGQVSQLFTKEDLVRLNDFLPNLQKVVTNSFELKDLYLLNSIADVYVPKIKSISEKNSIMPVFKIEPLEKIEIDAKINDVIYSKTIQNDDTITTLAFIALLVALGIIIYNDKN